MDSLRKELKEVLKLHHVSLHDALYDCPNRLSILMIGEGLIDKEVMIDNDYSQIMNKYMTVMDSIREVSGLEQHCRKLIDIIKSLGPRQMKVACDLEHSWQGIMKNHGSTFFQQGRPIETFHDDTHSGNNYLMLSPRHT